jgi:uncharacterized protein YfiM (DUF2279 family)
VRGAIAPHQRRLTALLEDQPGGPVPLGRLLAGMLAGAPAPDADPVAANRALLLVLGAHAAGRDLELLVPELARAGAPPPVPVTAHGRVDLAQHFLISAAIAALGTPELADAIGLEKEIRDATRGSGFSFTDLAADRAGTRFGEWITASRAQARQARSRLRTGKLATADVLPRVEGLPEFLSAREFERRYGAVGSAAYQAEARRIEARLDALAWYEGPPS